MTIIYIFQCTVDDDENVTKHPDRQRYKNDHAPPYTNHYAEVGARAFRYIVLFALSHKIEAQKP